MQTKETHLGTHHSVLVSCVSQLRCVIRNRNVKLAQQLKTRKEHTTRQELAQLSGVLQTDALKESTMEGTAAGHQKGTKHEGHSFLVAKHITLCLSTFAYACNI